MREQVPYKKIGLGFFGCLLSIAFVVFLLHQSGYGKCSQVIDIRFEGSVSGLRKNDPVTYKGIAAGRVLNIFLNPQELEAVYVRICIENNFPIKEDATAMLETRTIAGGNLINILPGSADRKNLVCTPKNIPIIKAETSRLDKLFEGMPGFVCTGQKFLETLLKVFGDEQVKDLKVTFKNIREITTLLNNKDVKHNLSATIKNIREASEKWVKIQDEIYSILTLNKKSIHQFFGDGSIAMTKFFHSSTETMNSLKKVLESIERSPSRFLYKDPQKGVKIE